MNPLASRKQLLLAESELNRAQLVRDWRTLADEANALTSRARTVGFLASSAVSLVTGLWSFRHRPPAPAAEKPSWLQTILKGAQLARALWPHSPPQNRNQMDE